MMQVETDKGIVVADMQRGGYEVRAVSEEKGRIDHVIAFPSRAHDILTADVLERSPRGLSEDQGTSKIQTRSRKKKLSQVG